MKNFFLFTLLAILLVSSNNYSQLLLNENFDYTVGSLLTDNGWNLTGTSVVNPISVVAPGLTYSGYQSSGIGNAARLTITGQDLNKSFSASVNSGSVYASILVNIDTARTLGDYFFHLGVNPTNTSNFFSRLWVRLADNGNLSFGLSKTSVNASNPIIWTDSIYALGTTHLAVVKYTFNTGTTTDDVASLFINPELSPIEPTPLLTNVNTQTDATEIGVVNLRQGAVSATAGAPAVVVDGIRVSTTWSDVVPVELSSFSASVIGNSVNLTWVTASETNNQGFEVQRAVNGNWKSLGFVNGKGTTVDVSTYSYIDKNVTSGKTYNYRLKQVDFDGSYTFYNLNSEVVIGAPTEFSLEQNYPNPFNPETKINFSLPVSGNVKLSVYNLLGQEVATLVNGFKQAGSHTVNFEAKGLQSGMYFYKLETASFTQTRKMTLLK